MITLTFNFKTSWRPVDHEASFYSQYPMLSILANAWEGREFDAKLVTLFNTDGTSFPDTRGPDLAHSVANAFSQYVSEFQVLLHSPFPTHYDLWYPFDSSLADELFLRVYHKVVPAPPWDRFVSYKAHFNDGTFDKDFNKYDTALYDWVFSGASGSELTPVTHASLGYAESIYGDVLASSPVFSANLVRWNFIQSHPTTVYGSSHNDTIEGGNVHDRLFGGPGDDLLIAGKEGNDYLNGGPGADTLVAGHGHDTMFGGTGADLFRFNLLGESPPTRPDVISDFHHGQGDKIDIDGFAIPGAVLFIGRESFAHRYHHNHLAIEMVRAVPIAPGTNLVQATDDGGAHVQLAIVVHGSVPRAGDFIFHA